MIDDTFSMIAPIVQNIIAAFIIWLCAKLYSGNREKILSVIAVATKALKIITPPLLRVAFEIFIIAYFLYMLRGALQEKGEITRETILGIALWSSLFIGYMYHRVFVMPNYVRKKDETKL